MTIPTGTKIRKILSIVKILFIVFTVASICLMIAVITPGMKDDYQGMIL